MRWRMPTIIAGRRVALIRANPQTRCGQTRPAASGRLVGLAYELVEPPRAASRHAVRQAPSVAAPFELGPQIKQLRFAARDLLPGLFGCDAADAPDGSHVVG